LGKSPKFIVLDCDCDTVKDIGGDSAFGWIGFVGRAGGYLEMNLGFPLFDGFHIYAPREEHNVVFGVLFSACIQYGARGGGRDAHRVDRLKPSLSRVSIY
jgi:hypothetical protein